MPNRQEIQWVRDHYLLKKRYQKINLWLSLWSWWSLLLVMPNNRELLHEAHVHNHWQQEVSSIRDQVDMVHCELFKCLTWASHSVLWDGAKEKAAVFYLLSRDCHVMSPCTHPTLLLLLAKQRPPEHIGSSLNICCVWAFQRPFVIVLR